LANELKGCAPDDFGVGFDAQRFRIVGHLGEFALGFLEIGVILDLSGSIDGQGNG
jgi:hypothetical protein